MHRPPTQPHREDAALRALCGLRGCWAAVAFEAKVTSEAVMVVLAVDELVMGPARQESGHPPMSALCSSRTFVARVRVLVPVRAF